jgi:WD40 repeat protein/serine/threonine protein kinase
MVFAPFAFYARYSPLRACVDGLLYWDDNPAILNASHASGRMTRMSITTVAAFAAALREYPLLDASQLHIVTDELVPQFADLRSLARELVRRDWLTPYQVNQLVQGRGRLLSLGPYIVLERLGEGGMGEVFKARHRKLGRLVALKVIRNDRLANENAVRRFRREIQAAAHLEHPNVVRAYDADEADGIHFFAMEFVEGTDLAKHVKQHGPLPVAQACDCARQTALALQHALERGMVHRDIKPHNLLLTAKGVVKVLDMGLARLESDDAGSITSTTLTQQGAVMGTPDFIAPEQAMDSHSADIRADLYSLGCTLYFLLTGSVPYPRGSALEKLVRHQTEEPQAIESLRPELSPALAGVVRRLMAKRPQDRFQTPAEVASVLVNAPAITVRVVTAPGGDAPVEELVTQTEGERISEFANLDTGDETATVASRVLPAARKGQRRLVLISVIGGASLFVLLGLLAGVILRLSSPRDTDKETLVTGDQATQAELDALLAREKDRQSDRARLWDDIVAFSQHHPARAREAHLSDLLLRLPSPLGALDAGRIPAELRIDGLPREVVAVLGTGLPWHGVVGAPRVIFAPDGSCVYCLMKDGTVALCDPVTGQPRRRFGTGAVDVDLRRDGLAVLLAAIDCVTIWDLSGPEPREVGALRHVPGRVANVCYSRDGKMAAVSVGGETPVVQLWDLSADPPRLRAALKGHTAHLGRCDFSPDRKQLATTSQDGTVRLWDLTADSPTTKAVLQTQGRQWWAESASFSPDGTLLAWTGSHDRIVHVDDVSVDRPREVAAFAMNNAAEGVVFSPDGTQLAAGLWGGSFVLWEVNGKSLAQRPDVPSHSGNVWSVSFSPDGKSLATASQDGTLRVWDISGPEPKDRGEQQGHTGRVTALAFAPNGKSLLSGSADRTGRLWELTAGEPRERAVLKGHQEWVSGVAFAADGSPVSANAGNPGHLFVWDVTTRQPRADLCRGSVPGLVCLAASPDGRSLAAASVDHTLRLWDLTLDVPAARVVSTDATLLRSLTFSADGKALAVGYDDGTVRLWGATAAQPREWGTLRGNAAPMALAFAPDAKTLARAGSDFVVTLWDVSGQKQTGSLAGHNSQVSGLAFTPDGKTLISADLDGRVILWDPQAGKSNPKLREWKLPRPIYALALAPDGRHIALGLGNGSIVILRIH